MNKSKHGYEWRPVMFNLRSPEVEIRYGERSFCDALNLTRADLREMQSAIGVEGLTEDDIGISIGVFQADMQRQIRAVMLTRMKEWQAKYPKRSVAFMDSMGAVMLHVTRTVPDALGDDSYSVDEWHRYGTFSSWKARDVFLPLADLLDWYKNISGQVNVGIKDILVGEPFWPIHQKNNPHFECDPREYDK